MPDSRYRITERVAAGGMAEVFRGVAESIQGFRKNVAIKRVLPALTKNKKFVAMFLDEARLSLHLQHANIVQVFDIGHTDETYFIVMEYVEGVDLKRLLEWRRKLGRPLTIGQTVYSIMEVCKGLAYAHEAVHPETGRPLGIVHRDVSPPNVLMSRNGEIKVTDFGLAKAAVQVEITDPGVVKGKMSYLSPEAARGTEVDRRADIFAVGILLYEMLTGKRLFYGETDYQTVELVRAAKIPPIGAQNPEVEPELEEVVRKSLAKRPDDRFQSATDLQDALAQYLFSRGLKMIQRDISDLVRACTEEVGPVAPPPPVRKPRGNVIDTMLQDEIDSFTSLEFEERPTQVTPPPAPMGLPQSPNSANAGINGDYIDPRAWADETNRAALRVPQATQAPATPPRPGAGSSGQLPQVSRGQAPPLARPPAPPARGGSPPPPPSRGNMPAQLPAPALSSRGNAPISQPKPGNPSGQFVVPPGYGGQPGRQGINPGGGGMLPGPGAAAAAMGGAATRPPTPAQSLGGFFSGMLARKSKPEAAGFSPTPAPERLADVLEPRGRRFSRGLTVGVLTGALAFGALVALAWQMMVR